MATYTVDSDMVQQTATAVRSAIDRIRGDVDSLNSRVIELQRSWTGAASTSFASAAQDWRTAQTGVQNSLQKLSQALDIAGRSYEEAESATQRMFR
ncbi:WXG100 family type VII secretion target [Schumannella soli]|uniref:ESAT-6-like protein n=1 Tax=Schumannella soli TaxID=2590779 RepID=A0A506Y535_9MICO|nr:WXG100 family type VII secretion target [Schumannella soli]TPW75559.1 WXG100 family type VII secretion target [Schumannella soli]